MTTTSPFPPLADRPLHPARSWRARLVAVAVVVVVVAAGATVVAATGGSGPTGYRTATATRRTVQEVLATTGTVQAVRQAAVAFPVAGTVAAVEVAPGDTVAVGQTLARLDTDDLEADLTDAKAKLADAELARHQALNGEPVTAGGSTGAEGTGAGGGGARPSGTNAITSGTGTGRRLTGLAEATGGAVTGTRRDTVPFAGASSSDEVSKAQQAVLAAQQAVDAALSTAQQALDAATAACPSGAGTGSSSAGSGTTVAPTTTPATPTTGACQAALANALQAQQALAAAQDQLVEASKALDALIARAAAGQGSTGGTGSGGAPSEGAGSGQGTGTGTGPPATGGAGTGTAPGGTPSAAGGADGSSGTTSPSAEQLVAYQSKVDAAEGQVAVAEQALDQASIVSPLAGRVVAVALEVGDDVSAGSSTATVTVVGEGGYEVATTVAVTDLDDLQVGATATVVPDGEQLTLEGKVVSIGVVPSGSSSTTYPVVIGFDGDVELPNGSTASVALDLQRTAEAVAVPTSAVQATGGRHTVTVLQDGTPTTTLVQLGAIGTRYTAITSGLREGREVVLADLSEPLPSEATRQGTNAGRNGPFGFPIGGAGGGPGSGFRPGG